MATDGDEGTIAVDGEQPVVLPARLSACERFPTRTIDHTISCTTSGDFPGPWTGLPVEALLTAADPPAETTHLVVTCRDGYRVCLALVDALDAIVAYRCDGETLAPDEHRLVGPRVGSTRSARGVARLTPVALGPNEEPGDRESLTEPDG